MRYAIAELIGERVVARRTRRRLTQQQVAERIGISRQALSSIERGAQTPHWPTLYAVAGVLRCAAVDGRIECTVDDAGKRLPEILAAVQAEGAVVRDIQVREPELEEVFVELAR